MYNQKANGFRLQQTLRDWIHFYECVSSRFLLLFSLWVKELNLRFARMVWRCCA